ncbi:MAG: single-stranded DNA-binding protein [bacterium]|nr:single-stranded DNA-binding protein [bacterium]
MSDLNSVLIVGRVVNEPDLKTNQNGTSSLLFTLVNNRNYLKNEEKMEESNFFRIRCYGRQSENLKKYLVKGKQIGLHGRLHQFKFKTPEGNNKNITEIVASQVQFLSGPGKKKKDQVEAAGESGTEENA